MIRCPRGVFNAPSILIEIADKGIAYQPGDPVHAINLSLLPLTQEDVTYLGDKLGRGNTVILSRGYGNCRVSSTNTRNVWVGTIFQFAGRADLEFHRSC